MSTEVTTPEGRGAPARDALVGPARVRLPARRGRGHRLGGRSRRRARRTALAVTGLALGVVLVVGHQRTEAETGSARASLASAVHRWHGAQADLVLAERRLAAARSRSQTTARSFAAAESALSSTQVTLAHDDAGSYFDGINLGRLDSCLSSVEQALNQLAVGQTAGGLGSLRTSSAACAALPGRG